MGPGSVPTERGHKNVSEELTGGVEVGTGWRTLSKVCTAGLTINICI